MDKHNENVARSSGDVQDGFTMVEIVIAITVITLPAGFAIPLYSSYMACAHAAGLILKFDQLYELQDLATSTQHLSDHVLKEIVAQEDLKSNPRFGVW